MTEACARHALGRLIHERREALSLSQEDLAGLLEVSQQTISRWESGENVPRLGRLLELGSILGRDLLRALEEFRPLGLLLAAAGVAVALGAADTCDYACLLYTFCVWP